MSSSPLSPSDLPAHFLRRQQEPRRVVVIGAGPVGLEAALYAQRLGCSVRVFEREEFVGPDVCAWGHVSMFTPWAANRTPLAVLALHDAARQAHRSPPIFPPDAVYPTGGEFLDRYLHPLAHLLGDSLLLSTRVVGVGRSYLFADEHADAPEKRTARRFRLLTRSPLEERMFTADFVLDASGVSHSHAWLGAGGLPALGEMGSARAIFYDLPDIGGRDRIHFLGKRTLLVGDGASAATSALALADVCEKDPPGTFIWAAKSRADLPLPMVPDDPLPRRELLFKRANLLAAQGHPCMEEYLGTTQVDALAYSLGTGQFEVSLQVN
ncbi:MAG: FAD-dependent oxidoreductase, partial [Candidatus Eremiobacteraeota bacterium]|nr:FAD-dependent oxidoreductase [Candidatus Eremiobacteraeota bacterium]